MSLLQGAPPLVPIQPRTLLIYPRGLELGESRSVLESAGIECRAADFRANGEDAHGRRTIYLIDHDRLTKLGDRSAAERLFSVIDPSGGMVIVLSNPGDYEAAWLSASEHVAGWVTRPMDPVALLAAVRSAERTLDLRDSTRESIEESDKLLQIGVALS